jgi:hypothetical protein
VIAARSWVVVAGAELTEIHFWAPIDAGQIPLRILPVTRKSIGVFDSSGCGKTDGVVGEIATVFFTGIV